MSLSCAISFEELPLSLSRPAVSGSIVPAYFYVRYRETEASTVEAVPKRKFAFGYDDQTNLSAVSVYDAAGTTITSTTCLVHDALNRLVAVGPAKVLAGPDATACRVETDLSAVQVRFQYDAQNRRVARQDGTGPWKQYAMGSDGSPLSELTRPTTSAGAWTPQRDYVWLEGKVVAQVEYPGPQVYAVHVDHLGLPRALTGSAGATVWSAVTRPYGDLVETSATGVVTNLRLPGQYHERGSSPTDDGLLSAIGLQGPYYNWNRWYLPTMGRYMELDPIAVGGGFNGAAGPEWYAYAEGNPALKTDARGLGPDEVPGNGTPCSPGDSTVVCCLKQHPGQYERCTGLQGPVDPDDLKCTVDVTPCQPDLPVRRPDCELLRSCCAAKCNSRFSSVGAKAACIAFVCVPAYLVCKLNPGG